MDDDQLFGCSFPYYSYAASYSSDFTTTSTSPPQQQHNHHNLSPLPDPPPQYTSLISPFDNFANSFHHHHDHDHHHPMSFGSVVQPVYFDDADADFDLSSALLRARIAAHPLYSTLLKAYIDCQKVGAPPEIANLLDQIQRENRLSGSATPVTSACLDPDPELDEFMESYCVILSQYRSDLAKPFYEATSYLNNMEAQLSSICKYTTSTTTPVAFVSADEAAGSSEEDVSGGESADVMEFLPNGEDQELKDKLLRKYSGYISSLKHEFSKKKKKGKLPKDAKQLLHDWWIDHYKWPYPTDADKIDLAHRTGLDQKQINNWFINQRKRHWKPSENMQFMEMDGFCGPFYTTD